MAIITTSRWFGKIWSFFLNPPFGHNSNNTIRRKSNSKTESFFMWFVVKLLRSIRTKTRRNFFYGLSFRNWSIYGWDFHIAPPYQLQCNVERPKCVWGNNDTANYLLSWILQMMFFFYSGIVAVCASINISIFPILIISPFVINAWIWEAPKKWIGTQKNHHIHYSTACINKYRRY